jgi:hypothetical protein
VLGTAGRMRENKCKVQTLAGKFMASVVWYSQGILLVAFLMRSATIISERYVQTSKKIKQRIRRVQLNRKMSQTLILPQSKI